MTLAVARFRFCPACRISLGIWTSLRTRWVDSNNLYLSNSLPPTFGKWTEEAACVVFSPNCADWPRVAQTLWHWTRKNVLLQSADWCLEIDFCLWGVHTPAGRFSILFWCCWTPHLFQSTSLQPLPSGFVYLGCVGVGVLVWSGHCLYITRTRRFFNPSCRVMNQIKCTTHKTALGHCGSAWVCMLTCDVYIWKLKQRKPYCEHLNYLPLFIFWWKIPLRDYKKSF